MTTGAGWQTCVPYSWEMFPLPGSVQGLVLWCGGVQTSHPEPHLTLGRLWVLRDGSSHLLWGKAGTAAASVAEPEDNPWHFGDI